MQTGTQIVLFSNTLRLSFDVTSKIINFCTVVLPSDSPRKKDMNIKSLTMLGIIHRCLEPDTRHQPGGPYMNAETAKELPIKCSKF